jgi:hypothetical protein
LRREGPKVDKASGDWRLKKLDITYVLSKHISENSCGYTMMQPALTMKNNGLQTIEKQRKAMELTQFVQPVPPLAEC